MEKYTYDTENNEKLTEVTVHKVWLKRDLLPGDSNFRGAFPEIWQAIQEEKDTEWRGFPIEVKDFKQFISSSQELFIVYLTTEATYAEGRWGIGQRVYLTNRKTFMDITKIMILTELFGCMYEYLPPPHEDFVNDFVNVVYF